MSLILVTIRITVRIQESEIQIHFIIIIIIIIITQLLTRHMSVIKTNRRRKKTAIMLAFGGGLRSMSTSSLFCDIERYFSVHTGWVGLTVVTYSQLFLHCVS